MPGNKAQGAVFSLASADEGLFKQDSSFSIQRTGLSSSAAPAVAVVPPYQYNIEGGWDGSPYAGNYIQYQTSTLGYQDIEFEWSDSASSGAPSFTLQGGPDTSFSSPATLFGPYQMPVGAWATRAVQVRPLARG